jgi:phage gp45-like
LLDLLDRAHSAIQSLLTGGKVTAARMGPRTLLQITGLDNEVVQTVELLLPPGYSARPLAGSDVLAAQVLGSRDQLVALGGDFVGHAIQDLAPGEFGLTDGTQTIVVRTDHLEMNTPTYLKITAAQHVEMVTPLLKVTGDIIDNWQTQTETMAGQRATYNIHDHDVPNVQPGASTVVSHVPNQQEL